MPTREVCLCLVRFCFANFTGREKSMGYGTDKDGLAVALRYVNAACVSPVLSNNLREKQELICITAGF